MTPIVKVNDMVKMSCVAFIYSTGGGEPAFLLVSSRKHPGMWMLAKGGVRVVITRCIGFRSADVVCPLLRSSLERTPRRPRSAKPARKVRRPLPNSL